MKPWPAELRERYPLDPASRQLSTRPWWRQIASIFRSDGLRVEMNANDVPGWELRVAEIEDTLHPLPHPGLRVGQTWALLIRDLHVFTITDYDARHVDPIQPYDGQPRTLARPWFIGSHWITDFELRDLVGCGPERHLQNVHAYLVADAVCQHLAPWSAP